MGTQAQVMRVKQIIVLLMGQQGLKANVVCSQGTATKAGIVYDRGTIVLDNIGTTTIYFNLKVDTSTSHGFPVPQVQPVRGFICGGDVQNIRVLIQRPIPTLTRHDKFELQWFSCLSLIDENQATQIFGAKKGCHTEYLMWVQESSSNKKIQLRKRLEKLNEEWSRRFSRRQVMVMFILVFYLSMLLSKTVQGIPF